jgi:ABC-type multidrug transport system fused ATPase/permease subunit
MFYLTRQELGKFVPFFLETIRMDIFDKFQEQDMRFYDNYQSGELNTRVLNDALDFGDTTFLITETLSNILISVLTFGILAWLNLTLALITLAAIPFVFLLMISLRKLARKVSKSYRRSIENVNKSMVELIEGIHVCKSYGQESTISNQFKDINKDYFKSAFRLTTATHIWRPLLEILTSITLVIVLFAATQFSVQNLMSPGLILIFILYLQKFFRPVMILSLFFPQLSSGMAAYERIVEVLDSEPKVQQKESNQSPETLNGDIIFYNVDFKYRDNTWVFRNLNLKIKKGEKLAIVGQTGAGKTSLISLLPRFYEFQQGMIKIDGIDIRKIDLETLRKNIGIVHQDVFLFSGTLKENLRYGKKNATEEEIWDAIRTVHAEELIKYLPNGLETKVGERGKGLSMGQKQLISFARAVLSDPNILILDEATSSVDAYTESIIQEALDVLLEDRTSIIIAHRLSTVINADRIIVMDDGNIIEEGNHNSLIMKGGKYTELYENYFKHQKLKLSN